MEYSRSEQENADETNANINNDVNVNDNNDVNDDDVKNEKSRLDKNIFSLFEENKKWVEGRFFYF